MPALNALTRQRPDALVVHPVASIWNGRAMVADYALTHRLPSITGLRAIADAGCACPTGRVSICVAWLPITSSGS